MTIGCFCGTYDPIHKGHTKVAEHFLLTGEIDEVWFIPTMQSPKKTTTPTLFVHRAEMIKTAIAKNARFNLCEIEKYLSPPYYTFYTLTQLKKNLPDKKLVLLIGEDNLTQFTGWYNYIHILEQHKVLAYTRDLPHNSIPDELKDSPAVKKIDGPKIDISATKIRKNLENNIDCSELLHLETIDYIKQHRLYQTPTPAK